MSKLATFLAAAAVLALCFVTLKPSPAEAKRGYWGPGVNVYVGPRWGYYRPRYYRGYRRGGYPYAYYPYWRSYRWGGWYY